MKKIFPILLGATLLLASACKKESNEIDRTREIKTDITMLNHVTENGKTTVELADYHMIINRTSMSGNFSTTVTNVPVAVSGFKLSQMEGLNIAYLLSEGSGAENLYGTVDFDNQLYKIAYKTAGKQVFATNPTIFYPQTTSTSTDPKRVSYEYSGAIYEFTIDPKTGTSTLQISNMVFSKDSLQAKIYGGLVYPNLKMEPTTAGYIISGAAIEPDSTKSYVKFATVGADVERLSKTQRKQLTLKQFNAVLTLLENRFDAQYATEQYAVKARGTYY